MHSGRLRKKQGGSSNSADIQGNAVKGYERVSDMNKKARDG